MRDMTVQIYRYIRCTWQKVHLGTEWIGPGYIKVHH